MVVMRAARWEGSEGVEGAGGVGMFKSIDDCGMRATTSMLRLRWPPLLPKSSHISNRLGPGEDVHLLWYLVPLYRSPAMARDALCSAQPQSSTHSSISFTGG